MSLCRLALRHCAVRALTGQTIVGANVADSDFGALDLTVDGLIQTNRDRPFVLVYTDESSAADTDMRGLRQNGQLDFVIEYGVASPMTEIDPETGEAVIAGVNIPATDANFEAALDLMDRQVMAVLSGADGWAELWRGLTDKVLKIERRRRASADEGMRIAARQTRITVEAKPDPVLGQALAAGSIWARFRAAVGGDPIEPMVLAMLGTAIPDWQTVLAGRGMTAGEARAAGFVPNGTILGTDLG